jgi:anti-sigma factor RsiW
VTATGGPVEKDDLHARIDGRLSAERADAVDAHLVAHPEVRERWSQYAEHRQALRAAFAAQACRPVPTRLRVAHLLAEQRRRRHRRFARIAAAVGFLILGGIGGWTARDVLPALTSSSSAALASTVFDDAIAAHRTHEMRLFAGAYLDRVTNFHREREADCFASGTEGSNPPPSSGESSANLASLIKEPLPT